MRAPIPGRRGGGERGRRRVAAGRNGKWVDSFGFSFSAMRKRAEAKGLGCNSERTLVRRPAGEAWPDRPVETAQRGEPEGRALFYWARAVVRLM